MSSSAFSSLTNSGAKPSTHCALSSSTGSDERHRLSRLDREGDTLDDVLLTVVGEPDVVKLDLGALGDHQLLRVGSVDNVLLFVEEFGQLLCIYTGI